MALSATVPLSSAVNALEMHNGVNGLNSGLKLLKKIFFLLTVMVRLSIKDIFVNYKQRGLYFLMRSDISHTNSNGLIRPYSYWSLMGLVRSAIAS